VLESDVNSIKKPSKLSHRLEKTSTQAQLKRLEDTLMKDVGNLLTQSQLKTVSPKRTINGHKQSANSKNSGLARAPDSAQF